jgi:hypothetical protein
MGRGIPNRDSITGGGGGLEEGGGITWGRMKWQQIAMTAIWPARCMQRPKKGLDMAEWRRGDPAPMLGLQGGRSGQVKSSQVKERSGQISIEHDRHTRTNACFGHKKVIKLGTGAHPSLMRSGYWVFRQCS